MKTLTAVILGIFFLISAQDNLSAENKQPPNPQKESLQFQDKISQHGITWTFNARVPVGRFVNGDYYVVGEATVNSVSPKPENGRNGSVLNLPTYPGKSGFDRRVKQGRYGFGTGHLRGFGTAGSAGSVPDTFGGISLRNYLDQFSILKQFGEWGQSDELLW